MAADVSTSTAAEAVPVASHRPMAVDMATKPRGVPHAAMPTTVTPKATNDPTSKGFRPTESLSVPRSGAASVWAAEYPIMPALERREDLWTDPPKRPYVRKYWYTSK
jgi:hypothetical protein